jgi:serpin B
MRPLRVRTVLAGPALLAVVACTVPTSPLTPAPALRDVVNAGEAAQGVNAFAADLYAHLRDKPGNLIVSPYGIGTALALTAAGAEGTTRDEMHRVLHLPEPEKLGPAFRALTAGVTAPPRDAAHRPELSVANSLWAQRGHPWKKEYLARAREDFRAGLFDADFEGHPDGARGRVNRWVEKETRDRIRELVPAGALDRETRLVLANAIYFKARWLAEFQKEGTRPEDFTLADGRKVKAPLMHQRGAFVLRAPDDFQVLRLPYHGDAAMYVFLPRAHDGLPALERKLGAQELDLWTAPAKAAAREVKVWLPRFKFAAPTELGGVLKEMGVREAFDPQRANFRGMTEHPQGLCVTRVLHKAFVETDEAGTEAAAATAVVMSLATAAPGQPPPGVAEFRADRPFLFVIRHETTGAILFIGRVEDPTR